MALLCHAFVQEQLLWARDAGMPWSEAVVTGAAEAHRFDVMMKLHIEHDCPWKVGDIARIVIGTTNEEEALKVLQTLWKQVCPYNNLYPVRFTVNPQRSRMPNRQLASLRLRCIVVPA